MDKYYFGLTDTGKTRENNEDSFIVQPIGNENYILAATIDGVGGYSGGEVAAAIAKNEISQQFATVPSDPIGEMIRAFHKANTVILAKKSSEKELSEMACVATMVLADIVNNQFFYAHVGDTRLYLLRDGSLIKISKDHSFVGFLEDSGRLDEAAAMKHPKRNEINKAIGFSQEMNNDESYIETGQSPFLPGDLLLICSDGLTDMVNSRDITHLLTQGSTLATTAANLISLANENGGLDNITVVLLKNHKAPLENKAIRPNQVIQAQEKENSIKPELIKEETIRQDQPATAPKKPSGFIALMILCIILLGSTVILYTKNQRGQNTGSALPQPTKKSARNKQELLLQDAFDHAVNDTIILSDTIFKSPILISDTLRIRRDTLYVLAKGLVLKADTGYKGGAIKLMLPNKLVKLDSLKFDGFTTAITVTNQNLLLKNITFTNCLVPLQNGYSFPSDQLINAELPVINNSPKGTSSKPSKPKNGAK